MLVRLSRYSYAAVALGLGVGEHAQRDDLERHERDEERDRVGHRVVQRVRDTDHRELTLGSLTLGKIAHVERARSGRRAFRAPSASARSSPWRSTSSPRTATPAPRSPPIAARAGISKPLIYQYFGSKDGLFLACLHDVAGADARAARGRLVAGGRLGALADGNPRRGLRVARAAARGVADALRRRPCRPTGPIAEAAWATAAARCRSRRAARSASSPRAASTTTSTRRRSARCGWGWSNSLVLWWLDHPEVTAAEMTERCDRLMAAVVG